MLCVVVPQYKAVSIPYPKDKDNVKAAIDADEKKAVSVNIHLFYMKIFLNETT